MKEFCVLAVQVAWVVPSNVNVIVLQRLYFCIIKDQMFLLVNKLQANIKHSREW